MDVVHLDQKQLAARWNISEASLERWWMVDGGGVSSISQFGAVQAGANSRKLAGLQLSGIAGGLRVRAQLSGNSGELTEGVNLNDFSQCYAFGAISPDDLGPRGDNRS